MNKAGKTKIYIGFLLLVLLTSSIYIVLQDSVRIDVPVDYTATLANSINTFQFNNVGYGQYTGAKAYRPREMLYFDWAT